MPGKAGKEEALTKTLRWLIIPSVFIVDRLLKIWVVQNFGDHVTRPVWPGVFHLTRVNNTGAAFGLWHGASGPLAVFSICSVLLITAYLAGLFRGRVTHAAAWALVAGGALGNLYDRLKFGYVIDYLDFRVWPVFNLADACISIGVGWIFFRLIRESRGDSRAPGPS